MGKWLELAARLEAEGARDNRDHRDDSPPIGPNVPNVPQSLPASITSGLARLQSMAAPRLLQPERWPAVVADALRLAEQGWAARAIGLGWSELDLFGAVTARDGDPVGDGLAVWLAGRRVLAICATFASVGDNFERTYFNRRERTGSRLLWDIGRSARE